MPETEEHRRESQPRGALIVENIPTELRERVQWAVWREERRDGEWTKVPYSPISGRRAKSNDPETWCALGEALDALAFGRQRYDGIAFALSEDDPYACIDLDDCRDPESGGLAHWAASIVSRSDSYSEASPSGTGVHVTVLGKLPPEGRKEGGVEMYESRRFITFTGRKLPGAPDTIEERQQALGEIHHEVFGARLAASAARKSARPEPRGDGLGDAQIISKASTAGNGGKFVRLLNGDWEGGYPSQSEADQALCSILAFWSGEAGQVDRIFRDSGLYREKWDKVHHASGETYGEATITRALAGGETYSGTSRNGSRGPGRASSASPSAEGAGGSGPSEDSGGETVKRMGPRILIGELMRNGVEPPEELLEGILLEGAVHKVFGGAGDGKTWLALWVARRVVGQRKPVLYLDHENGPRILKERMQDLGANPDKLDEHFHYYSMPDLTFSAVLEYRALLDELKPALVVFDSWINYLSLCDIEENNSTEVNGWTQSFATPARSRGIAVLILDHVPYNAARSRGSSQKLGGVDVSWGLKKKRDFSRHAVGEIELQLEKDREGYLPERVRFAVGGGESGFVFRRDVQVFEEADPRDGLTGSQRNALETLTELGPGGATYSEWKHAMGGAATTFDRALSHLRSHGFAEKKGQRYHPTLNSESNPHGEIPAEGTGGGSPGEDRQEKNSDDPERENPTGKPESPTPICPQTTPTGANGGPPKAVTPTTPTPILSGGGGGSRARGAPEALEKYLEDPPGWWREQARECIRQCSPERLVRPLGSTTASAVLGSPHRGAEAREAVESKLREMAEAGANGEGNPADAEEVYVI